MELGDRPAEDGHAATRRGLRAAEVGAKEREKENWIALTAGLTHTIGNDILAYDAYGEEALDVIEEHDGEVPTTREALESLPGVGRKTANVILNTAFGEPTIAVDTHIFRVSNRTGIARGKTVLEVEKRLLQLTPDEIRKDAHHWLILHGRYVCKARKTLCAECAIEPWCEYRHKELP